MSAPCTVCGGDGRSKIWGASAGLVEAALGESALVCARCKGTGLEPNPAKYVGEAFPLGDRRWVVAPPDKQPYIFDFKTGETEEIRFNGDQSVKAEGGKE